MEKLTMLLIQYILYDKLDFHCKKKNKNINKDFLLWASY